MSVNFDDLLAASVNDLPCRYDTEHAILYALGVGFARDGADRRELDYVYEGRGLRTVPAMAGALLNNDFLSRSGWDASRVFVSEQKLELYRPLPPSAELVADRRVVAVLDHGREHGVSIMIESEVRMAKDGTVLFTLGNTLLAGADGGFGGPEGSGPLPHKLPDRDADLSCELAIYRNQPLMFRLCGDRGPLYVEQATARSLGFRTTPMQEQCVAGIACRAILQTICEFDFTLVTGFDLRFTAPVYPGDSLVTEMWQDRNIVSFRCRVGDRHVIDNGKCTLAV
jgi:acyl dehydratase